MHEPSRAAVDQGQGGGDQRVLGRAEANLLCQGDAQHHASLAVIGQTVARGAVDQGVEVGQSAEGFADNRNGQRAIGCEQVANCRRCRIEV